MLPLEVAVFDEQATLAYIVLRAALEKNGPPIGPMNTMIAAHTLSLDVTLVTNNTRESKRAPKLMAMDWQARLVPKNIAKLTLRSPLFAKWLFVKLL